MKKLLLFLALASGLLAQQPTNVQKITDGTNTLTAPILVPTGSLWNGNMIGASYLPTGSSSAFGIFKVDGTSVTSSGGILSATAYALPAATTTTLGGVIVPLSGNLAIDGSGNLSIPLASSSTFGAAKVDGTTLTAASGILSAASLLAPSTSQQVFVAKSGNDTTGDGSISLPYLTIGKALTSITTATSSKYYQIMVGPGTYTENVVTKPAIWIVGANGGAGSEAGPVRINGTITLDSTFSTVAARWGFSNIVCLSSVTIDLHAIGGAVVDTGDFFNFVCFGNFIFTARASNEGFFWSNGYCIGTSSFNSGQATCMGVQFIGNWSASDSLVSPCLYQFINCPFIGGTETITGQAVGQCIVHLTNCLPAQNSLTITGADSSVYADSGSIPYASGLSVTGGATLTRMTDAVSLNYGPGVSGNWQSAPTQVNTALDFIAATGITKNQAANSLIGNNTGVSAAPVFHTLTSYFDNAFGSTQGELAVRGASTWGGAALTTNGQLLIGATAGTPAAGTIGGTANQVNVANAANAITLSLIGPYTPATYTSHGHLFGNGTGSINATAEASNGQIAIGSTGNFPVLATIAGTANQTSVANGAGTITLSLVGPYTPATYTSHGHLFGNGTSSINATAEASNGQIAIGSTGNFPTLATITGTASQVNVANGAGTITLSLIGPYTPATYTSHGLLYGSGSSSIAALAEGSNGQIPIGSTGNVPVLATITGTANQTSVANGAGTITLSLVGPYTPATYTSHGFLFGAGTSSITSSAEPSNGQIPIGSTGNVPTLATLTGTSNQVNVASGAGSITLSLVGPYTPATYTSHGLLYGAGASSIAALAEASNGQIAVGSTGNAPVLATITGTANQTSVANGAGTITLSLVGPYTPATYTSHGFLFGAGTSSITATAEPSNGQIPIGSTGNVPTLATITGTQDNLTVTNGSGTITLAVPNLTNAATAGQTPSAAARTYITGTDLHFPAGFLKVGTILRWKFDIAKTNAGSSTSTFDIAFGTTGTTTDTARCSFTKPAGTTVADEGWFEVSCVVKTASSVGVTIGNFRMIHNLQITGHAIIPCVVVTNTSGTFNTTTVTDVGVCITSGTGDILTINQVEAEVLNPG